MHRCWLLVLLTAVAHASMSSPDSSLKLQVRLQNHLTSYGSAAGTPFQCVVLAPLEMGGEVLIPSGSIVYGAVRRAISVRLGLIHERAALDLSFSDYQRPDGVRLRLAAKLASIDNARELVRRNGEISGILATAKPQQVLNGFWERPALNMLYRPLAGFTGVGQEFMERIPLGPAAPAAVLGLRFLVLRFPEPEIHLTPGTDLTLTVDQAHSAFLREQAPPPLTVEADLSNWIRNQPLTINKANGRLAADMVNITFIGSRQTLLDAFSNAGWYIPEPANFRSYRHEYVAFDQKTGYNQAPVSRLLYKGEDPDVVFEKSFDTVMKRHHVRIWKLGNINNKDVWGGAATHDIGMAFDVRSLWFRHDIDANLDGERTKVVTDLVFAGCSEGAAYTAPAPQNPDSKPHPSISDGRIAVLSLRPCHPPQNIETEPAPPPPGNKASRVARRLILESRDYVTRENAYYFGYQLVRHALHKGEPN